MGTSRNSRSIVELEGPKYGQQRDSRKVEVEGRAEILKNGERRVVTIKAVQNPLFCTTVVPNTVSERGGSRLEVANRQMLL